MVSPWIQALKQTKPQQWGLVLYGVVFCSIYTIQHTTEYRFFQAIHYFKRSSQREMVEEMEDGGAGLGASRSFTVSSKVSIFSLCQVSRFFDSSSRSRSWVFSACRWASWADRSGGVWCVFSGVGVCLVVCVSPTLCNLPKTRRISEVSTIGRFLSSLVVLSFPLFI